MLVPNFGQAWQDVNRFREIVTVLIRHGFGALLRRMNLQESFVGRMLGESEDVTSTRSMPERIAHVLQDLGPMFIKLGQILSTRPDLIPSEYIEQFKKLQSQASPLTFEEVSKQLDLALGKPRDEIFSKIEEKPLASASIAQVHVAYLLDGTEVVLKVCRPGIQDALLSDLSILKFLARQAVAIAPETELFDPVGIAEEFESALSKEIDFTVEMRNIKRFTQNFSNNPNIHIPEVYPEYSSKILLVMERIRGVKITDYKGEQKKVVSNLLQAVFEMIFFHTFFHGDLHPGNILIEEDGRIALIDFGLVGRLTPRMRDSITDLLLSLIRQDYEGVADVLYEIGKKKKPVDFDRFQADTMAVMDRHLLGAKMSEIEFGLLLQDVLEGAMRHSMGVPPDYTMMFKALITAEGVGKQLDPDMDLVKAIEPYVIDLVKQRYSVQAITEQALRQLGQTARFAKQLPVTLRQILQGIENGRLKFGLDNEQLNQIVQQQSHFQLLKLQIFLAGLFLLMATLHIDRDGPTLFGLPWFSFFGYIIGSFLAIWALYKTTRKL